MERHEYIFLPINIIPDEIIEKYFLRDMSKYGYVYAQIRKGIYGIPQVGIIVNYFLAKNLAPRGYYQCHNTTVMWKHKWNPVTFSLLVDGFGVKYVRKQHTYNSIDCIRKYYPDSVNWDESLYWYNEEG